MTRHESPPKSRSTHRPAPVPNESDTLIAQACAALECGDTETAADAARIALALAQGATRDLDKGWATWLLALTQMAGGDLSTAALYLGYGHVLAQRVHQPAFTQAITETQAFILEAETNPIPEILHRLPDLLQYARVSRVVPAAATEALTGAAKPKRQSGSGWNPRSSAMDPIGAQLHPSARLAAPLAESDQGLISKFAAVKLTPSFAGRLAGSQLWRTLIEAVYAASPLAYLILIALAELMTVLVSPLFGVAFHAAILVLIPLHYAHAQVREEPYAPLILTLALAPLIRIMSLTLPLIHLPLISWYVIIALPVFASAVTIQRTLGLTRRDLGIVLRWRDLPFQGLVGATGLLLGTTEFLILRPYPLVPGADETLLLTAAGVLVIGTGLFEEVIFRGFIQHAALTALGRSGLVYASLIFAALHIGYLSIIDLVFVFLVGLFFAGVVRRTGSLLGVVIAHSLTNILLYLVLPAAGPAFLLHF